MKIHEVTIWKCLSYLASNVGVLWHTSFLQGTQCENKYHTEVLFNSVLIELSYGKQY